ncbi:S1 RNA-binding domain-containing protein [Candidatus Gottesmanbacteria bacterium]|nr:S1 RNA-binding domain-containing protein [Candidatus Gottesmanbacteria bacterium]
MDELLASEEVVFRSYKRGDVVEGRVSSIFGKEVLIDFGGKMEGVVGQKEWDVVKEFVSRLKVGDKIPAVIISAENEKGQMIVSIRQAGAKYRWQKAQELLKSGEAISVKGVEINKGGLVVEFEGIRGFIPGSQLAPEHQTDMAHSLNRTLQVKVIEVDQTQNRLIFSERAVVGAAELTEKLEKIKKKIKIGEKYAGKVSAVMSYGIFVNLDPAVAGADGLVHISEISWTKVDNLGELFKVGDKVKVLVLGINETDGKLNLSIKQLLPDPWLDLAKKYLADQEIKGKVTRVSSYGIFIQLEEGLEGLIHISKVSPDASYEVGDKVTCTVESVDSVAHRISLIPVLKAKPIGYK